MDLTEVNLKKLMENLGQIDHRDDIYKFMQDMFADKKDIVVPDSLVQQEVEFASIGLHNLNTPDTTKECWYCGNLPIKEIFLIFDQFIKMCKDHYDNNKHPGLYIYVSLEHSGFNIENKVYTNTNFNTWTKGIMYNFITKQQHPIGNNIKSQLFIALDKATSTLIVSNDRLENAKYYKLEDTTTAFLIKTGKYGMNYDIKLLNMK